MSRQKPAPTKAKNSVKDIPNASKTETKQQFVIRLLKKPKGANIEEICKITNWQPHSVRGFLSGTLKKRMGFVIENEKTTAGGRRYKIVKPLDNQTSQNKAGTKANS